MGYSRSSKAMSPGDTLNSVDKRNVASVKNEVVNTPRWVGDLVGSNPARLSPFTVYSDGMTFSDSESRWERH